MVRLLPTSLAAALGVGLVLAGGCADVTPPVVEAPDDEKPLAPTISFPPVPDDLVAVYTRESPLPLVHESRYVLLEDHTFKLQAITYRWGLVSYPGSYTRSDGTITFHFAASSAAGPWEATGTLDDSEERLSVEYNIVMMLSDFVDGVYVRVD